MLERGPTSGRPQSRCGNRGGRAPGRSPGRRVRSPRAKVTPSSLIELPLGERERVGTGGRPARAAPSSRVCSNSASGMTRETRPACLGLGRAQHPAGDGEVEGDLFADGAAEHGHHHRGDKAALNLRIAELRRACSPERGRRRWRARRLRRDARPCTTATTGLDSVRIRTKRPPIRSAACFVLRQ